MTLTLSKAWWKWFVMFEWSDKRISRSCRAASLVKEENKHSKKIWKYITKMHRSFSDRMLQRQSSDKTTFRSNLSFRHPRREWVRELNYSVCTQWNRFNNAWMNVTHFTNNTSSYKLLSIQSIHTLYSKEFCSDRNALFW